MKKYLLILLFILLVLIIFYTMLNDANSNEEPLLVLNKDGYKISSSQGGKSIFGRNGKNGKIIINGIDIQECLKKKKINPNNKKIIVHENQILINDRTIYLNECDKK